MTNPASDLDRLSMYGQRVAAALNTPAALALVDFAREFNGTERAANMARVVISKGYDPAAMTESDEFLSVSYSVDVTDESLLIIKDVSIIAHYARDRHTMFYAPVVTLPRSAGTELAVDMVRALSVH